LGESGADAFSIMKIMGHSSVTVSQRYVHPTPEILERAFERLEERNQGAAAKLVAGLGRQLPATVEPEEVDPEHFRQASPGAGCATHPLPRV
jgi:hypothetical protein